MGTTALTQLRRLSRKMAQDLQDPWDKEHMSSDNDGVAGGPVVAASATTTPTEPTVDLSSGCQTEHCGNLGRLMSGIIAVNTLILGSALVSGTAYSTTSFSSKDLQVYLIILMLLSGAWMVYYTLQTSQKYKAVLFKDVHAGPVWLRGGLVVFGVLSLIMDIFKIANYVGYLHCESAVKVAFPVVQIVFVFVQTYFLWVHAKDCVELQWNLTRCGLMLLLSTNLILWMTAVTEESIHQTGLPDFKNTSNTITSRKRIIETVSFGEDACNCSHSACKTIKQAYYYLYPFNIEYSLFASAMAYVMWKNVGRLTDNHAPHHIRFHGKDIFFGPIAGILLVIAGLATFVVYEVEIVMEDVGRREHALMMHFVMNIVVAVLMSALTVVGVAIHVLHQQEHASGKNPTRSLDVGLLLGSSMGTFTVSYFTIVAEVGTGAQGHLSGLNLAWAALTVLQKDYGQFRNPSSSDIIDGASKLIETVILQNMFIIEGLQRLPYHEPHQPVSNVLANPYGCPNEELKSVADLEASEIDTGTSTAIHIITPKYQPRLTWNRRVLKEVCAFLLLANVILWIMPAFGARPQFDHYLETGFYQFSMWAAVVNIGLPFGIFYRMHSVASLFEVYLTS